MVSVQAFEREEHRDGRPLAHDAGDVEPAAMALDDGDLKVFNRHLAKLAKSIHPFFLSGASRNSFPKGGQWQGRCYLLIIQKMIVFPLTD